MLEVHVRIVVSDVGSGGPSLALGAHHMYLHSQLDPGPKAHAEHATRTQLQEPIPTPRAPIRLELAPDLLSLVFVSIFRDLRLPVGRDYRGRVSLKDKQTLGFFFELWAQPTLLKIGAIFAVRVYHLTAYTKLRRA
jgi:hypothetical protein